MWTEVGVQAWTAGASAQEVITFLVWQARVQRVRDALRDPMRTGFTVRAVKRGCEESGVNRGCEEQTV